MYPVYFLFFAGPVSWTSITNFYRVAGEYLTILIYTILMPTYKSYNCVGSIPG